MGPIGVSVLLFEIVVVPCHVVCATCYSSSVLSVLSACGASKGKPGTGGGRGDSGGLGDEGGFARD